MIRHIVLWRLHEMADGRTRHENALIIKARLETLKEKIKGLTFIEVGIGSSQSEQSSDISLYSVFESNEALEEYQNHPDHTNLKLFLNKVRSERRVIDYETL